MTHTSPTGPESNLDGERQRASWLLTLVKLAVIASVIIIANISVSHLVDMLGIQIWPEYMEIVDRTVLFGILLYICLMATPFLPGVEIGLTLMIVLGPRGVAITYVCTVLALTIGFGLGRLVPAQFLVSLLNWLHLVRAADLLERFSQIQPEERLDYLAQRTSVGSFPSLLEYRYLILAILFNLPGNALIGGGGGIAMMAGMSGVYSFPLFLLVVSVAILPVPVFFIFTKLL